MTNWAGSDRTDQCVEMRSMETRGPGSGMARLSKWWHARSLRRACEVQATPVEDSGRATRRPSIPRDGSLRPCVWKEAQVNDGWLIGTTFTQGLTDDELRAVTK
jgi:hypothetical protein